MFPVCILLNNTYVQISSRTFKIVHLNIVLMALGASSTNIQLHYDTVNIHTTTSNHTCENQAFFFYSNLS